MVVRATDGVILSSVGGSSGQLPLAISSISVKGRERIGRRRWFMRRKLWSM